MWHFLPAQYHACKILSLDSSLGILVLNVAKGQQPLVWQTCWSHIAAGDKRDSAVLNIMQQILCAGTYCFRTACIVQSANTCHNPSHPLAQKCMIMRGPGHLPAPNKTHTYTHILRVHNLSTHQATSIQCPSHLPARLIIQGLQCSHHTTHGFWLK